MLTAILTDPVFDGVGPLIHKILLKGWNTSQRNRISYEDYFQDFVVLWLKRRKKYDPTRGAMTTFASVVAVNYVRAEIKRKDRQFLRYVTHAEDTQFDVSDASVRFDQEELQLIEAYERQGSKKAIGLAKRLCEATAIDKNKLMETMESIQHKVKERSQHKMVVMV